MSLKHEFKCDSCGKKAESRFNGEHHLPPAGWVQLYDANSARTLNEHLCDVCRPKRKGERKQRTKK